MDETDWRPLAERYGPYVVLLAIAAFMFAVRILAIEEIITPERVYFSGNDPYYHARVTQFITEHFPKSIRFDPWSQFPVGTGRHSGFGGLFDQLVALGALVVGLGDPSARLVNISVSLSPPVFGTLTLIPVYLISRRVMGRWGALVPSVLLALIGGGFFGRTVISSSDHQAAEAFFATLAVLGLLYAVWTAYDEKPIIEDVLDRNWMVLRRPLSAGMLGGTALGAYLMTWGPGVMVVFTMGVFVMLQFVRNHLEDTPVDYIAFAAVSSMVPAAILTLLYAKSYRLTPTAFSLLQPLIFIGIAAGSVVSLGLSRWMKRRDYPTIYYPGAIVGLIGGGILVSAVVYPRALGLLESFFVRIYSFGLYTSKTGLTVAEMQPGSLSGMWRSYAALTYVAIVGWFGLVYRVLRENRPTELLLLLWAFTNISAYFTMSRFDYYLGITVALISGYVLWWVGTSLLGLLEVGAPDELQAYQVLGVIALLVLVVPGNVVAMGSGLPAPVWQTSDLWATSNINKEWQQELAWMNKSTPREPLEFNGVYAPPADGDFDYPEGAYGVMSWWDYGHWITMTGKRIPIANPFQEGPRVASSYLQAQSEERANLILEALPAIEDYDRIEKLSNADLRGIIATQSKQEASEDTRYVVIDDQMLGKKFSAITRWAGPGGGAYVQSKQYKYRGRNVSLPTYNRQYRNMIMYRLYVEDASGLSHYRLIHESNSYSLIGSYLRGQNARSITNLRLRGGWEDVKSFVGSVRKGRRSDSLVPVSQSEFVYNAHIEATVKIFERVEGATLRGTTNATNTSVTAVLRLQTNTGRNFTYVQRTTVGADGEFNMTVPYATNDAVTPEEGGTDSGIEARGNYSIFVGNPFIPRERGSVTVPEKAVLEGRTIEVALSPVQRNVTTGTNGKDGSGGTNDQSDDTDETQSAPGSGMSPHRHARERVIG